MRTALRNVAGVAGGVVVLGLMGPATATAAGAAGTMATGIVHVVHGIGGNVNTNQSSNWSGYNIGADYPQVSTGTTFTSASGQWTVPTATQRTVGAWAWLMASLPHGKPPQGQRSLNASAATHQPATASGHQRRLSSSRCATANTA